MPYSEEDARYFFGRDRERRLISAALRASRLTVLYGESGAGKSSVLAAGVAHDLRDDPDYALLLFRNWRDEPLTSLLNAARDRFSKLPGFTPHDADAQPIHLLQGWSDSTNRSLLVVLDQFDEYFQYHPVEAGDGTFAEELPRMLNRAQLPVNFLIAIREDALGMLDRFKGTIPNLFDNILRIEHLSRNAAQEAIVRPLKTFNQDWRAGRFPAGEDPLHPVDIEDQVAAEVVSEIIRAQGEEQERVQAPYLQLVMARWWEREQANSASRIMRFETLRELGGVKAIVDGYLEDTLKDLKPEGQEVVAEAFRYMVTPTGRKIAQTLTDLRQNLSGAESAEGRNLEETLGVLHEARLLRKVPPPRGSPPGETCYEFAHDVVAKAAFEWRNQFLRTRELARFETRITHELDLAREMQQELLPRQLPKSSYFELSAALLHGRVIGGDYYDVLPLTDGRFGIAVGDVSGKGIPAAMMAMMVSAAFAALALPEPALEDLFRRVNDFLFARTLRGMFAVLFYGVLDHMGRFSYVNAGQVPPLIVRAVSGAIERLEIGNLPIGLIGDATFGADTIRLEAGDYLVMFTDGIIEAMNADDELFGEARLIQVIKQSAGREASEVVSAVHAAVDAFVGGPLNDDRTLVVLQYGARKGEGKK